MKRPQKNHFECQTCLLGFAADSKFVKISDCSHWNIEDAIIDEIEYEEIADIL